MNDVHLIVLMHGLANIDEQVQPVVRRQLDLAAIPRDWSLPQKSCTGFTTRFAHRGGEAVDPWPD